MEFLDFKIFDSNHCLLEKNKFKIEFQAIEKQPWRFWAQITRYLKINTVVIVCNLPAKVTFVFKL